MRDKLRAARGAGPRVHDERARLVGDVHEDDAAGREGRGLSRPHAVGVNADS